jgi:hypothetical protein
VRDLLGEVALARGDAARASEHARAAMEEKLVLLPEAHPELARSIGLLGRAELLAGNLADAERALRHALHAREGAFGPVHAAAHVDRLALAELLLRRDAPAEAQRHLAVVVDDLQRRGAWTDARLGRAEELLARAGR